MLAEPEHYKGILYVRLSSLPGEQKEKLREAYNRESIIKIIKDNSIINDCILYTDYLGWYHQYKSSPTEVIQSKRVSKTDFAHTEQVGQ